MVETAPLIHVLRLKASNSHSLIPQKDQSVKLNCVPKTGQGRKRRSEVFRPASTQRSEHLETREPRHSLQGARGVSSPMPSAVAFAVIVPLRTTGRNGDEPRSHVADRPSVSGRTGLWRPADDLALAERGPRREQSSRPAPDAVLPEARFQRASIWTQELPLSAGRAADGAAKPGLVRRRHLYPDFPDAAALFFVSSPSWTGSPARSIFIGRLWRPRSYDCVHFHA